MIPSKVKICGITHAVRLCEECFNADASHFGEIEYAKCEIRINKDMPEEMQMQTLVHEMLHGMLVMIGEVELSQDEKLVQSLAMAINQSFGLREEAP